jgi:hypothetical protein
MRENWKNREESVGEGNGGGSECHVEGVFECVVGIVNRGAENGEKRMEVEERETDGWKRETTDEEILMGAVPVDWAGNWGLATAEERVKEEGHWDKRRYPQKVDFLIGLERLKIWEGL